MLAHRDLDNGCSRATDSRCNQTLTLSEVAAELGISRRDAALLERGAILKARAWARENGFQLEDLLRVGFLAGHRQVSSLASRTRGW